MPGKESCQTSVAVAIKQGCEPHSGVKSLMMNGIRIPDKSDQVLTKGFDKGMSAGRPSSISVLTANRR